MAVLQESGGQRVARTEHSDGSVKVTRSEVRKQGVEGKVGGGIAIGGKRAEARASADAGWVTEEGESWVVNDAEVAAEIERQITGERRADYVDWAWKPGRWLGARIEDFHGGPLPEPDITYTAEGVDTGAAASFGVKDNSTSLAGGDAGQRATIVRREETDHDAGERTESIDFTGSTSSEFSYLTGRHGNETEQAVALKAVRDLDTNQLLAVEVETTTSGENLASLGVNDGQVRSLLDHAHTQRVVETRRLELRGPEERAFVEEYIDSGGDDPVARRAVETLMRTVGENTVSTYRGERSGTSIGADVGGGVSAGAYYDATRRRPR